MGEEPDCKTTIKKQNRLSEQDKNDGSKKAAAKCGPACMPGGAVPHAGHTGQDAFCSSPLLCRSVCFCLPILSARMLSAAMVPAASAVMFSVVIALDIGIVVQISL